jgi:hypothetical protein
MFLCIAGMQKTHSGHGSFLFRSLFVLVRRTPTTPIGPGGLEKRPLSLGQRTYEGFYQ